jgi:hypothetical protein
MIPCFVTNEGEIVSIEKVQPPSPVVEMDPREKLRMEAEEQAAKQSTPKKVTEQ